MNEEILFTCKTSQTKNIPKIIIFGIFSAILIKFANYTPDILFMVDKYYPVEGINFKKESDRIILSILLTIMWANVLWTAIALHCTEYHFAEDRLIKEFGVLNKYKENLEFYRIKDYSIFRSFISRIFRLSDLTIISTDRTHPRLDLRGITNFNDKHQLFRKYVEKSTETGRGREIDVV